MEKRVLYLAFRKPFPATDGYRLRVLNYCKLLKKLGYSVDIIYFEKEAEKDLKDEGVFNNTYGIQLKKITVAKNLFKSIILGQSLQENIYISKEFEAKVEELVSKNNYEFVISSYIRMYKYLNKVKGPKKIIDFTDSISMHYSEALSKIKGIWRYIYGYELKKVQKYERKVLQDCDKAMITSPKDKEHIGKDTSDIDKITVLPQWVNSKVLEYRDLDEKDENLLVFLGKMDYLPNVDAACYFCNEVMNKIKNPIRVKIIGGNPTKKIVELAKKYPNVEVTGFLDDPFKVIKEAKLMVSPIRIGGGIQNKILEGMALGKTVVTIEGREKPIIGTKNWENIVAVKESSEFAEAVDKLLENKELRTQIGKSAKILMQEHYKMDSVEQTFKKFLDN